MAGPGPPVRVLTAVPGCDGHDRAITAINLELIPLFGDGSGLITPDDADRMHGEGTDRIFLPGASFHEITACILQHFARTVTAPPLESLFSDPLVLARRIT